MQSGESTDKVESALSFMEVLLWVEDLTPYLSIFWEILKVGTSDCQEFIPGCIKRKRVTSTTTRRLWLHSSWHSCLPFQDIHSHIPESTSEAGVCASRGQCSADAVSQTLLISPPGAIPLWQEHRAALFLGCHSGKFTALFTYGKHLENAIDWLSEAWDRRISSSLVACHWYATSSLTML